jgi:nucleoside-triphosphatase THEP1
MSGSNPTYQQTILDSQWLQASVVGSLWASIEIILGSFMHNLQLPFAGTLLAMLGVMLLIAFHQRWRVKGLFWRAGLICALMKSISPSAILLGPMTGILAEALLLELVVRIAGTNLVGYLLGGAVALSSAIVHKLVTLLIMYGFDFVNVIVNLYAYAADQLGFSTLAPRQALLLLFAFYALLGIVAAAAGYVVGRKSLKLSASYNVDTFDTATGSDIFALAHNQHFSVPLLFYHLFAIAGSLVIMSYYSVVVGAVFVATYMGYCIIHYRRSLRHLKRPMFWVQALVLTFLAVVFYNAIDSGYLFSREGLVAGLTMNLRAVLIVVGFSAISVELRNPVVKAVLMRRGLAQLYLSLGLSFSVLPMLVRQLNRPVSLLRHPVRSLMHSLGQADSLLEKFTTRAAKPKVVIITGEKHSGKTTFASDLAKHLKEKGIDLGGFVAPGSFIDNRRVSFDMLALATGETYPLCNRHHGIGIRIGPFWFDEKTLERGKQLLDPAQLGAAEIVFIDEVGPLELKDEGWAVAIDKLMQHPRLTLVMVVRRSMTEQVINRWQLINTKVFDIELPGQAEEARKYFL